MNDHMMRPGGTDMTCHAARQSGLKKGNRLLDIGCGRGDTAALLTEVFGFCVTGVDIDKAAIQEAQSRFPDMVFSEGDGVMLDFASKTFNGVLLECTLSLIPNTTEALHEAWCVLKPGGRLIISDLYWKNPTPSHLEIISGNKTSNQKPRTHGECQMQDLLSECVAHGAFVMDELQRVLEELNMDILFFEDRTSDLTDYAAQILLDCGSFEQYAKSNPTALYPGSACLCELQEKDAKSNLGYFLLIAEKKEA